MEYTQDARANLWIALQAADDYTERTAAMVSMLMDAINGPDRMDEKALGYYTMILTEELQDLRDAIDAAIKSNSYITEKPSDAATSQGR